MTSLKNRILGLIPLILIITFLSFSLMKLAPGDPTTMMMDPKATAADALRIRHNLGLDKPLLVQYGLWLNQVIHGNLGYSLVTGKPVLGSITERLPATLLLSVTSLVIIVGLSLPLGLLSGAYKNSAFDHVLTIMVFIGFSIPTFWLGMMLILFFCVTLNLFPTSGFIDPGVTGLVPTLLSVLSHLFLPLLTIVIGGFAGLTRFQRFSVITILHQDYIKAARARGLSETRILFRHAFKNAALPLVTLLGLELPGLLGGAFVIEYIFAWPGMGQLGVAAVFSRDYPILMGTLLIGACLIILGNLLSDLTYRLIDPRIRT